MKRALPALALLLLAPSWGAGHAAAARAACLPNLATALSTPQSAGQLITVEAAAARATYGSFRLWRRTGGCWVAAGGPWTARLGRHGISGRHREGDGTTPTGAYALGP